MLIKICGLSRKEDIMYVNEVKPDYIGFVFAKSRRQVNLQQAKELKQLLDKNILAVGVFVDEDIEKIAEIVNQGIIDMIQLHGHEDQAYIDELNTYVHCPIIKALRVKNKESFVTYQHIDYYLLDGCQPGSGQSFDWNDIPIFNHPFFLAGGICLDNIDEALKVPCFAVDVSSGVETNGHKDLKKIKELVRRVRK